MGKLALLLGYAILSAGDRYSRVVFSSAEGKNLWSIQAIKSMCNLDNARVCWHHSSRVNMFFCYTSACFRLFIHSFRP